MIQARTESTILGIEFENPFFFLKDFDSNALSSKQNRICIQAKLKKKRKLKQKYR
jgi:hypothetical protein